MRLATPRDLPAICQLLRQREGHHVPLRGVPVEQRLHKLDRVYRQSGPWLNQEDGLRVLVSTRGSEVVGYVAVILGLEESITGEKQAMLHDFGGEDLGPLLDAAMDLAQQAGDEYLVTHLPAGATGERAWFEQNGFDVDMWRIMKRVNPRPIDVKGYTIRRATPQDRLFILLLNTKVGSFTIPPLRNRDPQEIAMRYLAAYSELDLLAMVGLVAERDRDLEPAGQTMIKVGIQDEVTGEDVGYVYDIAVHPDHMGSHLGLYLMQRAELELQQRGIQWLAGDISAANPRPLHMATQYLGFELEFCRYVRSLRPSVRTEEMKGGGTSWVRSPA